MGISSNVSLDSSVAAYRIIADNKYFTEYFTLITHHQTSKRLHENMLHSLCESSCFTKLAIVCVCYMAPQVAVMVGGVGGP